jgi:hypothetical protein
LLLLQPPPPSMNSAWRARRSVTGTQMESGAPHQLLARHLIIAIITGGALGAPH